ncbi:MAG: Rrf2 family transcriptional regulator [Desulfobacterota bacterium]|nr:Rrf2 family transcriptional regulator [Thermodesulfobacteriota bacterium]
MYVTREADYAVRCVLYLAQNPDKTASAKAISESMEIPRTFLAKILQRLAAKGIVSSVRGVAGGFQLAKKPREISLLDVIEAIQGPSAMNVCAIDRRRCSRSSTCTVHPIWTEIRTHVEKRLRRENFATLAKKG